MNYTFPKPRKRYFEYPHWKEIIDRYMQLYINFAINTVGKHHMTPNDT